MRKALLFMVAVAMVAGGLWLLGAELFFALKLLYIVGGAVLATLGVYLLSLFGIKGEGYLRGRLSRKTQRRGEARKRADDVATLASALPR